jgi:hypothetical protein
MPTATLAVHGAVGLRVGQLLSQQVDDLLGGGKNSERRESSSVEHEFTVNENLELPVGSADDLHVRV